MQYALETREMHGRDEMWYAWEDNIKLELSSVSGCEVQLSIPGYVHWQALTNLKKMNPFTSWATANFSRSTLLHALPTE